jgi:hypothetical protein
MFESIPAALASANAIKNIVAGMKGFNKNKGVKSYAVTGNLSSRLKSCPRNFPIHLGSTAKQSLSNRRL